MRSKKLCYILLSALFIMLGLSLNVCSDTSALKHDYYGLPFFQTYIPRVYTTDSDGRNSINWDYDFSTLSGLNNQSFVMSIPESFLIGFEGDSYSSDISSLMTSTFPHNLSLMSTYKDGSSCSFQNYNGINQPIKPLYFVTNDTSNNRVFLNFNNYYFDSRFPNVRFSSSGIVESDCLHRSAFGESPQPAFNNGSLNNVVSTITCGVSSGASCGGFWDTRNFIRSKLLPFYYTADGFYIHSTVIDTDSGIHYNHSFSFKDLFGSDIHSFSRLTMSLFAVDSDYFTDSSNFYEGRHLEFRGVFEFDGSFAWHSNIESNGSYFKVSLYGDNSYSSGQPSEVFNCITNLRTLSSTGLTQLEYSCSGDLSRDYAFLIPFLQISGNGNYVFLTDDSWRIANQYLVTDNDETPGVSFNSSLNGSDIPGDAHSDMDSSSADWTSSLINLFNFNMINPFAPIFSLFTSQESCAQIPTLSEFLNSEETQVCPFFSSRIRSVVTPVLGLSAMMLVFGFAVRWLGARSGNFFEDSGSIAPPGDFPAGSAGVKHVGWRRK